VYPGMSAEAAPGSAGFASPRGSLDSTSQVLHVRVRAQARVVCQIPANMVGVFVDHDLIARPVLARDDVVVPRGDVPVEIVEPEALRVSSGQHEYMFPSKATGAASVCPRLCEVVMRVVGAGIVSDPPVVPGVHVRNVRMTIPVHFHVVLGRGLFRPGRGRSARRLGSPRGSGTPSGDVATANRRGVTAAA